MIAVTNDYINFILLKTGLPARYIGNACPIEANALCTTFNMFSNVRYIALFWNDIKDDDSLPIEYEFDWKVVHKIFYKIYNKERSCSSKKVNFMLKFSNAVLIVGDNLGYMMNRIKENAEIYNVK